WIHFITWWARNFFSPRSSPKKRSRRARSKSKMLVLVSVGSASAAIRGLGGIAAEAAPAARAPASSSRAMSMAGARFSLIGQSAGVDVGGREEVRDLDRGVLQRIRTVHRVGVDAVGEVGADG